MDMAHDERRRGQGREARFGRTCRCGIGPNRLPCAPARAARPQPSPLAPRPSPLTGLAARTPHSRVRWSPGRLSAQGCGRRRGDGRRGRRRRRGGRGREEGREEG
eukprot:6535065-Pyramimonas_sp.AAC.1